jgi:hypothetical protein
MGREKGKAKNKKDLYSNLSPSHLPCNDLSPNLIENLEK